MVKKCVIFILLAALFLGLGAVSAGAETAQGYEVGYAKVDINPYWTAWMEWSAGRTDEKGALIPNAGTYPYQSFYEPYDLLPLPMAGYGSNESRLSRPKLMDDNGSGVGASRTNVTKAKTSASASSATTLKVNTFYSYVYANNAHYQDVHLSSNRYTKDFAKEMGVTYADGIYGENDGDGVWSTCVLVKDPQTDSFLLLISIDAISVSDTLNSYIRAEIMAQPEIRALGLTEDRILVNANHTHGSVSLGTQYSSTNTATTYTLARNTFGDNLTFTEQQLFWYLNFYKNYLCDQLAKAAVQAAGDLEPALTMEKGSIDASAQSGHLLNGVRHNVQTYQPTNGSKSAITYVRGSSFNNYMRSSSSYDSHFAGNGFTASQPVSEANDQLNILEFTFKNKAPIAMVNFRGHSTANNKEAAKALHYNISADWVSPLRRELEKAGYRFTLLYGNSGNLGTGVSSDADTLIPYSQAYYSAADGCWILPATPHGRAIAQVALALLGDAAEKDHSILDAMHPVPMGKLLAQKTTYLNKRQEFSPLAYAAALRFYNAGSPSSGGRYTIPDGTTVTNEGRSVTLGAGEGGTFVIASKYHANSIVARYGVTNKTALELNTVRLGSQVAFYSTPIEASDRYFTNTIQKTTDILENASKYNDWWNLNEPGAWGTPFDLSLTNGSGGYITNELAYDYGKDYTGTDYMIAIGCYESQNSNSARGEGEKIVATLNSMLRNMEPKTAYCAHCGENALFTPLSMTSFTQAQDAYILSEGHYFLAGDFSFRRQVQILQNTRVCLDLNGCTYNSENYTQVSRAFSVSGTLNVMDLSDAKTGQLQGLGIKTSLLSTLRGGTVLVEKEGRLNLYSGTLTQNIRSGYSVSEGGVVCVEGSFCMYGGTVTGGAVPKNGGNIYVTSGAQLFLHDGRIENGRAEKANTTTMGGNVYCGGSFTMTGGQILGGFAHFGGNVQIQGAGASFTMQGGRIEGGTASYKTDVADLCTGQASNETGRALFRMEGGYIGTAAYSQGDIVLTGTTDTATPVRVVVKKPGECLVIEGPYRGNIQLVLNDPQYLGLSAGAKIGTARDANIDGAIIRLADYPDMELAVRGNDLVLQHKVVAQVNGTDYRDLAEAVRAYNAAGGQLRLMAQGLALSGLTRDLHLDLNGKRLTSVDTGSYTLYCRDSATDDFSSPTESSYGSLPLGTRYLPEEGYLDVVWEDRISFHRYALSVTHVNLRPGNTGIYYRAVFRGDEVFRAQTDGIGVAVSLTEDRQLSQIPESNCVFLAGSGWTGGDTASNSVLIRDILKPDLTPTQNAARGQMTVYAVGFAALTDGRLLTGEVCGYSLRQILEQFDSGSDPVPTTLTDLYRAYENVLSQWDIPRIKSTAKN